MTDVKVNDIKVIDQATRDELLDISQSFIVQAPAGSGKTELLTQRILALLASVQKPESILAITFTRKAAAEMRDRVISALILAQSEAPTSFHELARWKLASKVLKVDQEKGWNLIANPNRLNLYTIDALSASLSGALPLLSQTGTIPSIAENAYQYYLQAAERMLSSIADNDQIATNIKILLTHKDNNLKQLVELFAQLLAKRLQWSTRIDSEDHEFNCEQIFHSLNTIIREKLQTVYSLFPASIISELPDLLQQASDVLSKTEKKNVVNLISLVNVDALALPNEDDLVLWKGVAEMLLTASRSKPCFYKISSKTNGFPPVKNAVGELQILSFEKNKNRMKEILSELTNIPEFAGVLNDVRLLPDAIETALENPALQAVLELLPVATAHLKVVFKEFNVLDFSELSLSSLNALGREDAPTDIALALDYQIEHLLVDEFQDTSSPQIRLMELLTAGWDGSSSKTIFLVGDPMQSIYRFRDANVSLFMQIAQDGIGQLQPKFRQLEVNFRSDQQIIDWINLQFDRIMPTQDNLTLSAVSYAYSTAFHPNNSLCGVKCSVTVDAPDHLLQAQQILQVVIQHLEENKKLGSTEQKKTLAILVRSRGHLKEIITALNSAAIDYQAVEIEPLIKKIVASDINCLALALTDVYDQLSWIACLRSPWFALKLNDIGIILSEINKSKQSIPAVVQMFAEERHAPQSNISKDAQQRINKILPILNHAIKQKGKKPFAKWLYGCFKSIGGLLQIDLRSEHQDLETCIDTIADFSSGGEILDRQGLQQALERLYAAPNPNADNQVQIMTIHKSKGLEFDRVILPRLDARNAGADSPLLKWSEVIDSHGGSHNLLAVSKQTGKENDSIYQYISYLDKKKEKYENQRVLYVAATRAKSELYLFANICLDTKKKKNDDDELKVSYKRPIANSFLEMLWDGVKENIELISCSNKLSKNETQLDNPVNVSEYELASMQELDSTESQLNYIFPPRKTKRVNIESIEGIPVLDGDIENSVIYPNALTDSSQRYSIETQQNINSDAAIIGAVIHKQLEWLSYKDIKHFTLLENWHEITKGQLLAAGILTANKLFKQYIQTVVEAISNTLADDMGRFILERHLQAKNEMVLHKNISHGVFLKRIVDRTFVVDGVRWIVDYKTAMPVDGESQQDFVKKEIQSYRQQMNEYVEMFKDMEKRKIKIIAGLYFPMIQYFAEVYRD